jgi:hypothetical protein
LPAPHVSGAIQQTLDKNEIRMREQEDYGGHGEGTSQSSRRQGMGEWTHRKAPLDQIRLDHMQFGARWL